jgi:hypothetical protein
MHCRTSYQPALRAAGGCRNAAAEVVVHTVLLILSALNLLPDPQEHIAAVTLIHLRALVHTSSSRISQLRIYTAWSQQKRMFMQAVHTVYLNLNTWCNKKNAHSCRWC